eukprot:7117868-Prymnesium_polylepis.1
MHAITRLQYLVLPPPPLPLVAAGLSPADGATLSAVERKLEMRERPTAPDFSGWNWQAVTLPRQTADTAHVQAEVRHARPKRGGAAAALYHEACTHRTARHSRSDRGASRPGARRARRGTSGQNTRRLLRPCPAAGRARAARAACSTRSEGRRARRRR